ncbi:mechanosensitive ion channel family protein [Erythrobacter sp. R86502]|uniref:mechanosensitive ion channel family protein n=1 Tax=Erythrobacter sp. R86502 TaxID=3093846 RepID=UPI0036D28734
MMEAGATGSVRAETEAAQLLRDFQDISYFQIFLIAALAWAVVYLSRRILPFLAERGPSQTRLYLLGAVPIVRLLAIVAATLWILPLVFNITLQNFLVIAGAASVAIGFAFKDFVSSLIAGIVAIFERPYRSGDWVKIGEDYGEIRRMGLRGMTIQTPDDNAVVVPHSRLWTENISNSNDGAQTLQCVANFYLSPGHDAAKIRDALYDIALTSPYLDYARPVVVVLSEEPWGTHYKIRAYPFDMRDQFLFISDMTARGKRTVAMMGGLPAAVTPAVERTA